MTDRAALYAAVLAAPDDDTPRLVYADYLDDTGGRADAIRARFIRNQIALARTEPGIAECDRLYRATKPVADHYKMIWATGTDGIALAQGHVFARGFLEQVTCYAKRFLADGVPLFEAQPVRAVKFADMSSGRGAATAAEMAASPLLGRLHTLHLVGDPVNDGFMEGLLSTPHLDGIRCFRIERSSLGPSGVTRLLSRPRWHLTELDLTRNANIGDPEVVALAKETGLARLRCLDLSETAVGIKGVEALARSRHASGLEILRLGHGADATGTAVRGPGAVALAESPHLRGVKELDLHGQELRKRGAESFAAAYAWPGLRRLGLRGNQIPSSSIPTFAANPHLASLAEIDFRTNPIRSKDLTPLREACPDTRFLTDDTDRSNTWALAPEDRP
ncbi:MAG TPA: TIGR02996 domain-containing protein [Urbifossiella sp.]|nr:TIGR02996 domain-containing protein [Urbifossiella sp.]